MKLEEMKGQIEGLFNPEPCVEGGPSGMPFARVLALKGPTSSICPT